MWKQLQIITWITSCILLAVHLPISKAAFFDENETNGQNGDNIDESEETYTDFSSHSGLSENPGASGPLIADDITSTHFKYKAPCFCMPGPQGKCH